MRETKNVKVVAENVENRSGFDIYLDFSGQREYLTSHRHNGQLYKLLKDGMYLDDIRRWKPVGGYKRHENGCGKSVQHLENAVHYLVKQADKYIYYRAA